VPRRGAPTRAQLYVWSVDMKRLTAEGNFAECVCSRGAMGNLCCDYR
jgi:hypothetical protein